MRNVLDCGVLLAPGHESAMRDWVARYRGGLARIRLHLVPLSQEARGGAEDSPPAWMSAKQDVQALARLAVSLRRYDSCILPVAPTSVAWARMALAQAGAALTTPILLLMSDMKAPAIEDLLGLGAADFIAQPACLESMRVRLSRLGRRVLWRQAPPAGVEEPIASYAAPSYAAASYAAAADDIASPWTVARPPVSLDVLEQALAGLGDAIPDPRRLPAPEPFRLAKARVVDGFERDYIHLALSRHGGNVAQAARACAKHRRAFWALMRKHGIAAAPYRQAAQQRSAHSRYAY